MATIQLHNLEGKVIGDLEVPAVFEGPVSREILWQVVNMHLANQRQGTAETKTRGQVSGGGKKPWAQKHTGRARHGTIRSPIWRKGGVVFGPHPREYRYDLPAQVRRKALLSSLRAKMADNAVVAVEPLNGIIPKTKVLSDLLVKMKVQEGALVVIDRPDSVLARISRNIPRVAVKPASDLNCYDVLSHARLVVTADGLKKLEGAVK